MRFLWNTALKDWRRHRRNPLEFLLWIGIPLLIGGLIILATGGRGGPQPQAHVLVADEDDSFLSGMLVGALSQDRMGGLIRAEAVEQAEGRRRLDKGEATALLVIPDGFGQAVLEEEPTTLKLWTNPEQYILPRIVEESLSILVDGSFYLQRMVGEDLRAFADGPPDGRSTFPDALVAAFSVKINQIAAGLMRYFNPLVIKLETRTAEEVAAAEALDRGEKLEEPAEDLGWGVYFLPSILLMSLLFMAQGLAEDIWQEQKQNTLRRLVASPQSVLCFLSGKLLAGVGMIGVVCLVGLCVGYAYLRLNVLTLPLALAWSVCTGAMLFAAMNLIQLFAASQRAGNIITMILIFPLMMLGGSFFPFEMMPAWMAAVGKLTPNGWALQQLKEIIMQKVHVPSIALGFVILIGATCALFMIGSLRLRRGFVQG